MNLFEALQQIEKGSDVKSELENKPLKVMRMKKDSRLFGFIGMAAQLYQVTTEGELVGPAMVQGNWVDEDWLIFEITR